MGKNERLDKTENSVFVRGRTHPAYKDLLLCLRKGMFLTGAIMRGKPFFKSWVDSKLRDENRLAWFLHSYPDGNVEVLLHRTITKDKLYQVAAIDIDERKGGHEEFARLCSSLGLLPPDTPRDYRKGGGHHYYVNVPIDSSAPKQIDLAPGVELRRGQIAIPPSTGSDGPDGERRAWEVRPKSGRGFPLLPQAWLDHGEGCRPKRGPVPSVSPITADDLAWVIEKARRWLAKRPGAVQGQNGSKHTFNTFRVLLKEFMLPAEVAWTLGSEWNHQCEPPWSEKELRHKLDDANAKGVGKEDRTVRPTPKKQTKKGGCAAPATKDAKDAAPASKDGEPAKSQPLPDDFKNAHFWAKRVIARYASTQEAKGDRTILFYRDDWYVWLRKRRCFRCLPDSEMRARITASIKKIIDEEEITVDRGDSEAPLGVTTGLVNNVRLALTSMTIQDGSVDMPYMIGEPEQRRNLICMNNGIVDLDALLTDSDPLAPHTPRWFSTVCLPYSFDPVAQYPKWEAFLARNLEGDRERMAVLQEFAGYLLTSSTDQQKFLVMVGDGSNGKSVACTVLSALLGEPNVSSVPLECFGERFALTQTLGKLANIASEIGEIDKAAEGKLKAFTSGDPMYFDRKNIPGVNARPTARLILATNNLPRFSDRSKGLSRRMIVMPFNVEIKKSERVIGMDKPDFWHDELPGIFRWAVEGLRRLRGQGRFTESEACNTALEEYQRDSNPARVFISETCRANPDASPIPTTHIYGAYRKWCADHGSHPLGDRAFGKEIQRAFRSEFDAKKIERRRNNQRGHRYWYYSGLEFCEGGIAEGDGSENEPELE